MIGINVKLYHMNKDSSPFISIVITTHNLENHINRCFEELFRQTFQDFDIIVIDDASNDGTADVIRAWEKKMMNRICAVLLDKNLGMPARTRNYALESGMITGEYVLFLDGDDSIEPDMLEKLQERVCRRDSSGGRSPDIVICAYDRIDSKSRKVLAAEMRSFPESVELPADSDLLAFINTASWNKLWKKEVIQNARYSDFSVGEEIIFNFDAYQRSSRIDFIDEPLIHYEVREDSVISNTDEDTIWTFANAVKDYHKGLSGMVKETFEVVIFFHIGLSMALRAANNPKIDIRQHIGRTEKYFKENYGWFKGNPYFRLSRLLEHGAKGLMIWGAFHTYKMKIFGIALSIYMRLGLNIRF